MTDEEADWSGRLDRLLTEPGFLAAASVPALLRRRQHTTDPATLTTLAAVELAANAWHSDADRLDALHVAALKVGHHPLADRLRRPNGWHARNALWRGTPHLVVEHSSAYPHPLAAVPMPDGSMLLASTGAGYVVRLRDVSTGEPRAELRGHTGTVQALTSLVLPDGTLVLASAGEDCLRLWHPATGEPHSRFAYPPGVDKVYDLAVLPMPDGTVLLAGGGPGQAVRLWDPATGELRAELLGHTNTVWALAVLPMPDGRTLLASGGDDGVLLWDPVTATRCDLRFPLPQFNRVYALTALPMPDGTVLLAGAGHDYHGNPMLSFSEPCVVRLWDPVTGELRRERHGHLGPVRSLTAVRAPGGGMLLASAGEDRAVRLWDPATGTEHSALEGHPGRVHTLAAVPTADGGTLLATAGEDSFVLRSAVRLWDLAAGGPRGTGIGHTGEVRALAALPMPDGSTLLASGGADHVVRLWDPVTGEPHRELPGHELPVAALITMPMPDGGTALLSSDSRTVRRWDLDSGTAETVAHVSRKEDGGHEQAVLVLPDGTRLLARGACQIRDGYDYDDDSMDKYEKYVDLLEVGNPAFDGEYSYELNGHNTENIGALAIVPVPDGVPLIASAEDDGIRLWHPVSGELVRRLDHRDVHALALVPGPDGGTLLAAAAGSQVRLWDPLTGLPHNEFSVPEHSIWAFVAVPAPDGGTLLATAGQDRVVRLWDAATGELRRELTGHTAGVHALTTLTLADGTVLLASGSAHGEIIVWERGSADDTAG
ncbi:WD40 repeat domain-containing protein [Crossiella cryophila]|uniref:WD40 repeat protein n=1 Tax=Crossiella cryophila TaxID=43355 RepID=A0A7W7FV32_9PSEU|nr:WD40 repeat domain-containing protein [Crossiella cryophila]MBB4679986.1 WD40 repeat protein [Crossiella cryophila]